MDDIEIQKSIQERLKSEHGDVVRMQSHDAPDWFGDGWMTLAIRRAASAASSCSLVASGLTFSVVMTFPFLSWQWACACFRHAEARFMHGLG